MTEPVKNEINARCPLCRGRLLLRTMDNKPDGILVYRCENGDYECKPDLFDAAWTKHAAALNTALAILLTELKDANLKK